jgi:lipoprotein-anchoring transpeptidase ErfK/SrfK
MHLVSQMPSAGSTGRDLYRSTLRSTQAIIMSIRTFSSLAIAILVATCLQGQGSSLESPEPSPGLSPVPTPALSSTPTDHTAAMPKANGASIPINALTPDTLTRLEIFLDAHLFGPGKIDGKPGEFVGLALSRYQMAQGKDPQPGQVDPELQQELKQIEPVYIGYTFTQADRAWIGRVPRQPAALAKVKKAIYRSPLDFVAERFHSDQNLIRKLNPKIKFDQLKPGTAVQVPNVPPFQIETINPVPDVPPHPEFSQRTIKVDTKARMLDLNDGDRLLAAFPITPGSQRLPAPIGSWKIVKVTILPNFRWDEAMLQHGRRSGNYHLIPPGPRNLVGIVWIGLNKNGIGIHGTDNPETIGRSASHGCIRLANWDAIRLAGEVTTGMMVEIF